MIQAGIVYLTLPYRLKTKADIIEIEKGVPEPGDSRIINTYTVDPVTCQCPQIKLGACIHTNIFNTKLLGPTLSWSDVDDVIAFFKKTFGKLSAVVLPVGNTKFRKKPAQRVELIVESMSDGVELWSFYRKALVRLVMASEKSFDKTMEFLNYEQQIDLDDGQILDF